MYVDGHGQNLEDLLGSNIFRVPEYQRAYAWKSGRQVKDFWTDFQNVMAAHQDKYFMGTMLFAGIDGEGQANKRVVIDGQQRLATFLLFLAAIRDALVANSDLSDETKAQQKLYIENMLMAFDGRRRWTRLVLSDHDQEHFRAILMPEDADPAAAAAASNMKATYTYFKRELRAEAEAHGTERLMKILDVFLTKLVVVRIESPNSLDAHVVFESVNDRGLPLTPSELVKNYLLSRAVFSNLFEEAHRAWQSIERRVGFGAMDNFLLYYWNSHHHPKVQKDKLYREFKAHVKQYNVEENLRDLSLEAEIYEQLINPSQAFWRSAQVVALLQELDKLGVKQVYVLLLAIGRVSVDGRMTNDDLVAVIKFLLDFSFGYSTIMGMPTNVLEKEYSRLAVAIREDETRLPDVFKSLAEILPSAAMVEEHLASGKRALPTNVNKYVLFKIAELELQSREIVLAQEEHHLEHVIPQRPDADLLADLEARGIDHASVVDRLGNLTVILGTWNQEMSNWPFDVKRPTYERSLLAMNQGLGALQTFGNVELRERQRAIAAKAIALWPANIPERFLTSE